MFLAGIVVWYRVRSLRGHPLLFVHRVCVCVCVYCVFGSILFSMAARSLFEHAPFDAIPKTKGEAAVGIEKFLVQSSVRLRRRVLTTSFQTSSRPLGGNGSDMLGQRGISD